MITSLIAQATYESIEFSIFHDAVCLEKRSVPKQLSSKNLATDLQQILTDHHSSFEKISFIGANRGPAPFTTLRVLIATLNGIGFALHKPLIGVDGLAAFAQQVQDPAWPHTVIMLNAYHHDVYFAYAGQTGICPISTLIAHINTQTPTAQLRFLGNGALQHASLLKQTFGERAHIDAQAPTFVSLEQIAINALQQWPSDKTTTQLAPLYLKKATY